MEWYLVTLEYLKTISWPITIIILALLFRFEIKELIKKIIGIQTPFGSIDLSRQNVPKGEISKEVKEGISKSVNEQESKKDVKIGGGEDTSKQIATLQIALLFEKIYNNIYGSQIALLKSARNDMTGLWHVALCSWYEGVRQNDLVLKNYNFDDYIKYLISCGLVKAIEQSGGRKYMITDTGVDFLNYIEKSKYPENKLH